MGGGLPPGIGGADGGQHKLLFAGVYKHAVVGPTRKIFGWLPVFTGHRAIAIA